jgi:hypothetical protein
VERDELKLLNQKVEVLTIVMAAVLDKIAALAADTDDLAMSERIPLLYRLGLDRTQVAKAVGTSPEVVSVRLAEAKRKKTQSSTRPKARTDE